MYTRGPIAALMPTSPGTLVSEPMMRNLRLPSASESPTCAFSETSSDGSTTTWWPACNCAHAVAGAVVMVP